MFSFPLFPVTSATSTIQTHSVHSPSSSPKIYHLSQLQHGSFDHLSSSASRSASISSFTSSSSSSSCWYSPSVWPSAEECCHYILWALVGGYLLLFFTSSFLALFSDHSTTCHCGPHQTSTHGPNPQKGETLPIQGPADFQCKSQFDVEASFHKSQWCGRSWKGNSINLDKHFSSFYKLRQNDLKHIWKQVEILWLQTSYCPSKYRERIYWQKLSLFVSLIYLWSCLS